MTIPNEECFQDNLARWSRNHPKEAIFLPYADCSSLPFCKTAQGELNLQQIINGQTQYFHSNENAFQESLEWFKGLSLSSATVLIVYGVGLGYLYDAAKEWLHANRHHRLIFLEDDASVLHRLFETKKGSELLQDQQVQIVYFDTLEESSSPLTELYWNFMSVNLEVTALPYYLKRKAEKFNLLHHKLLYDATLRHALVEEYLSYGAPFFQNFYPNMLHLPGAFLGDGLAGKFKQVPAIICGAGPSLNKHFGLLKELHDKALIFAGGSALNAFLSADLLPHLGAGVDPNSAQLERVKQTGHLKIPFLYRNRMYHPAFRLIQGPRLYVTGSGGYDVANWFEQQLEIYGEQLEEGYNVVNFCLDVARCWGCNPIIFVGMDLAFTGMEAYARGIIKKTAVAEKEILEGEDFESRAFPWKDIYGKPVYTLWKWLSEATWISDFAKAHPEITILNATEGGIGFSDIPNVTLESAAKKYLIHSENLSERLEDEIQKCALPQVTAERMIELMEEMKASLLRSQEHLEIMHREAISIIQQLEQEQLVPMTLQSGLAALSEIELAEEPAYKYVLEVFNIVYSKSLNRDLQLLQETSSLTPDWQIAAQKLALNNQKLAFLRDVAAANAEFIRIALEK